MLYTVEIETNPTLTLSLSSLNSLSLVSQLTLRFEDDDYIVSLKLSIDDCTASSSFLFVDSIISLKSKILGMNVSIHITGWCLEWMRGLID